MNATDEFKYRFFEKGEKKSYLNQNCFKTTTPCKILIRKKLSPNPSAIESKNQYFTQSFGYFRDLLYQKYNGADP